MTDKYQNLKKHTYLQKYFEDKTGLKAKKEKNFFKLEKTRKESFNEAFVFLHISDYSYQELDNLIYLYFSEVWGKKDHFEVETKDLNHLGIVFTNKDRKGIGYGVIVNRYTNINLKSKTYSLDIKFFTNELSLQKAIEKLKNKYKKVF